MGGYSSKKPILSISVLSAITCRFITPFGMSEQEISETLNVKILAGSKWSTHPSDVQGTPGENGGPRIVAAIHIAPHPFSILSASCWEIVVPVSPWKRRWVASHRSNTERKHFVDYPARQPYGLRVVQGRGSKNIRRSVCGTENRDAAEPG